MGEREWVQHKSGQGVCYQVIIELADVWVCDGIRATLYLPKSEYVLAPPPERWVNVTAECEWRCGNLFHVRGSEVVPLFMAGHAMPPTVYIRDGYRLQKVPVCTGEGPSHPVTQHWAFVIEKK